MSNATVSVHFHNFNEYIFRHPNFFPASIQTFSKLINIRKIAEAERKCCLFSTFGKRNATRMLLVFQEYLGKLWTVNQVLSFCNILIRCDDFGFQLLFTEHRTSFCVGAQLNTILFSFALAFHFCTQTHRNTLSSKSLLTSDGEL